MAASPNVVAIFVLFLLSASAAASDPPRSFLSLAQARREFKLLLPMMYRGEFNNSWRRVEQVTLQPLRNVKINSQGFSFEDSREAAEKWSFGRSLKTQYQAYRFREMSPVAVSDDHPNKPKAAFFAGPESKDGKGEGSDLCTRKCGTFYWMERRDAERFAAALNRLIEQAKKGSSDEDLATFQKSAVEWRQAKLKPPLSPEADRHRILAEEAVRRNDLEAAVQHYDEALEATPMWPEGWMNAALIYAELKDYEYAAERMKRYLVLLPDAPDAKAARTQMIVWEEKAK